MKSDPAGQSESVQWLPAERLGQLNIDEKLRPWLIGFGMLSERLKAACGDRFSLRLVDQWSGLLSNSHKLALRTNDNAGMFRNVELCSAGQVWVFAQTLTIRALRHAELKPAGLWARRSRVSL